MTTKKPKPGRARVQSDENTLHHYILDGEEKTVAQNSSRSTINCSRYIMTVKCLNSTYVPSLYQGFPQGAVL